MKCETRSILVVDDDTQMRVALNEAVTRMGYQAVLAGDPIEALKKLNSTQVSMIITDMKMPRMDGLTFIKEVRKRVGGLPVLVITGYATVENAVEVMKEGACDYLMKPFSIKTLQEAIESILSRTSKNHREVLTSDPRMREVIELAKNVAMSDITVLILGESGTGKELLARYIHNISPRNKRPFVAVNCAAIPDNLLESELFGYEKGAFTGAIERKAGKFEIADGGTILLDEIGEMSSTLQAKLLRVLQEREIDRIGGKQPVPVDVRIIATTNRDLEKEISEGRFREDLYFRLSVFPLKIPPLRERPSDIKLLAEHFVERFARQMGKDIKGFTDEAMDRMMRHQWKGNVRELENVVQRAVLIAKGEYIDKEDLIIEDSVCGSITKGSIKDMEMEMILKTLKQTKGNKTQAARILGVSVRTIRNKLNNYYGKNLSRA